MPAFAAQYQFAAAFIVFLVALAGLALVALRDTLTTGNGARVALGAGFVSIGAGAFLEGSLLVADAADPRLLVLRVAGVVGLGVGTIPWRGPRTARLLVLAGAGALAGAVVVAAVGGALAASTIAALGGLTLGAGLLVSSRIAIAARVAASAAATLLLVVLVLSVALSTVLARTVEEQALADLDDRALTEAGVIETSGADVISKASVVASLLARVPERAGDSSGPALLARIDPTAGPTPEQQAGIQRELDRISADVYPDLGIAYVGESGRMIAGAGAPTAVLDAAVRAGVVASSMQPPRTGRSDSPVVDDQALVVGVRPIDLAAQPIGAVVGVRVLDDGYFDVRSSASGADALALVTAGGVVAHAGPLPADSAVSRLARVVLGSRAQETATTDERFAAARAVRPPGGGPAKLAVIASRSTDRIDGVRADLFRTFFVIAFGGTVLALLLAALVGDRIGSGIRRLTLAAEAIQRGQVGVRSGVRSPDEVGVLGATFDTMSASIEDQRAALVEAAERVSAIVAGMGEALVALDAEGHITDFNAAAEDLFGLDAAGVLGSPIDAVLVVTSEDGAALGERIAAIEPDRWSALATAASAVGGAAVPVALTAGPLRGPDGSIAGGVVVLRDLRGEREVERMKRHFLSRVGHELRTPLTPLIGYSQMLAGRELPRTAPRWSTPRSSRRPAASSASSRCSSSSLHSMPGDRCCIPSASKFELCWPA